MSARVAKTEHAGAKHGCGSYRGRKVDAKANSNATRRQSGRRLAAALLHEHDDQGPDPLPFWLDPTPVRRPARRSDRTPQQRWQRRLRQVAWWSFSRARSYRVLGIQLERVRRLSTPTKTAHPAKDDAGR